MNITSYKTCSFSDDSEKTKRLLVIIGISVGVFVLLSGLLFMWKRKALGKLWERKAEPKGAKKINKKIMI